MATTIVTAQQMKSLDGRTIDSLGVPGLVLMEQAGSASARAMAQHFGPLENRSVTVLCGRGNNGGDGFVIARLLRQAGARVSVWLAGDPARVRGDAKANMTAYEGLGGALVAGDKATPALLRGHLATTELIVDALLGTGLNQPIGAPLDAWVAAINDSPAPVVAVDIPSGIHADNGQVMGQAVQAELTVTFAFAKRGHYLAPGLAHTGALVVADIGIPESLADHIDVQRMDAARAGTLLPTRPVAGHKGSFGHTLIVGASPGMTGAVTLAAQGAVGIGSGLVSVACPAGLNPTLELKLTEAMTLPMAETLDNEFSALALDPLLAAAADRSATVIGPGMGTAEEIATLVRTFTARHDGPLVIDADGLNAWARHMAAFPARVAPTVITPHPGEMARLLETDTRQVQQDRIEATRTLAREREVTVVLKGACTITADPFGATWVNDTGNPALASGGSGDVLAGMIGGLLAQGLGAGEAASLGVYLHGLAADRWSEDHGPAGLAAGTLAQGIPATMQALRCGTVCDRTVTMGALFPY